MKTVTCLSLFLALIALPIFGHATTYTYDDIGRLTSATYSNGDYVKYSYDAGGNITVINSSVSNSSAAAKPVHTAQNSHSGKPAKNPISHPIATASKGKETRNIHLAVADTVKKTQ